MRSEREGNCGGTAVRREREKGTVEGLQCAGRERRELWRDCSAQ